MPMLSTKTKRAGGKDGYRVQRNYHAPAEEVAGSVDHRAIAAKVSAVAASAEALIV